MADSHTAGDELYRDYLDTRAKYHESVKELGSRFDKGMFTLSGGALGLSLSFIHNIVTPGHVVNPELLKCGWALLFLTILVVFVNMLLSQNAHEHFTDVVDDEFHKGDPRTYWKRVRKRQEKYLPSRLIGWLNYAMFGTFTIGVLMVLLFTITNLSSPKGS